MKRILLITALGFIGMFVAHFLLFILSLGLRLNFMPYLIAYPLVYITLIFFLTKKWPAWWLSNTIFVLLIPFIYWYVLLWSDQKFSFDNAIRVKESSGMLLILPLTFALAITTSLFIFRRSQQPEEKAFA